MCAVRAATTGASRSMARPVQFVMLARLTRIPARPPCASVGGAGEVVSELVHQHVLPQTWHPHWPLPAEMAKDEAAVADCNRSIRTIGNLTLVNGRPNSSLSNAPWDSRRSTDPGRPQRPLPEQAVVNKGRRSGMRRPSRSARSGCTKEQRKSGRTRTSSCSLRNGVGTNEAVR